MISTLILPDDKYSLTNTLEIRDLLEHQLDLTITLGFLIWNLPRL